MNNFRLLEISNPFPVYINGKEKFEVVITYSDIIGKQYIVRRTLFKDDKSFYFIFDRQRIDVKQNNDNEEIKQNDDRNVCNNNDD